MDCLLHTKNSHLITIGVSSKRSNDNAEGSKVKRLCKEKNCIIHCTDDRTDLVSPKNDDSWKTLLGAAEIRKHQEICEISKSLSEGDVPRIYCHRKCRSIFSMKKLLDKLSEQSSNSKTHQEQGLGGFLFVDLPIPARHTSAFAFSVKKQNFSRVQEFLNLWYNAEICVQIALSERWLH